MTDYLINSAALYFGFDVPKKVPSLWLTRAIDFFSFHGISPDSFIITATETFSSDEIYSFTGHQDDLFRVVNEDLVESIGLYSNPNANGSISDWQTMVSVEMRSGMVFVGMDEAKFPEHDLLLYSTHLLAGELLEVKYGISYKRLMSKGPHSYASGVLQGSLDDIRNWLTSDDEESRRITAWLHDKLGSRRYLNGMFRGTYPASIISSGHLVALRGCASSGRIPGKITPLVENKVWIWELANSEMDAVEKLLRKSSLLIE